MLEAVITWSLRNRALVIVLSVLLALLGAVAMSRLNVDAFPDTTPVQVQINTVAPSLVPEEVERQITFPVELAISGLPGLQQVRSLSQFGLSQVVITFEDGTDIYFARQLIAQRLDTVNLPEGMPRPEMGPVSTGLGEVFHYLLKSEHDLSTLPEGERIAELTRLRTAHDWDVKPGLRPVRGVAEINSWGGFEKQYQVRIDPTLLIKHDLSFQQVVEAVKANNLNVGGGNITGPSGDMLLVHGIGRTTNVGKIEDIVVASKDGVPIRVRDVGQVTIGHEIRRGLVTADGQGEAVLGLGFMLMGESSYTVANSLADKMAEIDRERPKAGALVPVYNRTTLVDQVIDTVKRNLFDGALLVIALLYIFLGNLRAGLIVALAIPLSMLFAFSGMWRFGIAATLLSLGAIDFGIVVDSSVVVVENAIKKLSHHAAGHGHGDGPGPSKIDLIRDAAIEVRTPTVFGQMIIMIVYIPILTLEGVEGKMFKPMAWTVVFVLIGSLVFSLTLIPVLCTFFLPRHLEEKEVFLVRAARWLYGPMLRNVLKFPVTTIAVALACLAGAGLIAAGLGTEFVPRLSEGAVVIGVIRPPGTSLEESVRVNTVVEKALLKAFPDEIDHVWTRTGAPEVATDPGSIEMSDVFITLHPRDRWTKAGTQAELVTKMEKVVDDVPGQILWFTQPIEQRINEMISGVRSDVALKLFGNDLEQLTKTGRELERVLASVEGSADVATEQVMGQPVLQIRIRQDQIARYGVPAQAVLDVVESVGSKVLGEVVEERLRFPLVVRLPESLRATPESIASILVATPSGERLPLSRLAEIEEVQGAKTISREWGTRRVTIQANVRGRDIGSFVAEARDRIAREVTLPDGHRIEWGGQFENMKQAQARLTVVVPLALLLIVGLLYLTYRNAVDTAFVFASVPFACVGGILGLWARDMPLSISAAVGFITLSGVSVLNSMIVVSFLRGPECRGMAPREAVLHAALSCLRTVLMTALVASVGFIPMALSTGTGAEVQRPLATVVIGGVLTSSLMTLFVLPALCVLVQPRSVRLAAAAAEPPMPA